MDPEASPREAAVLIPAFRDPAGEIRLVLIRRSEHGIHAGQIAFPGGRREATDVSPLATAIREAQEEIGLSPEAVQILEALPALRTRTTNYLIHPFLARVTPKETWSADGVEVVEILSVRVRDLVDPEHQGESVESFPTWPGPQRIRFIRIGPHRLWGATYRILTPLLPRLMAGEWAL